MGWRQNGLRLSSRPPPFSRRIFMIEAIERRLMLHSAFISGGVLFLQGVAADDDQLVVSLVNSGTTYRAQAINDGFSQDFAATAVTKGINIDGSGGNDDIS